MSRLERKRRQIAEDADNKKPSELKSMVDIALDKYANRTELVCICVTCGKCELGEDCPKQKLFLMDITRDWCTSAAAWEAISRLQADSIMQVGDAKSDPDEKFPNWQDHVTSTSSGHHIRWPHEPLLMAGDTHTVTVPVRLPDKWQKAEAVKHNGREPYHQLVPTKHFIKSDNIIKDGYTTILSARVTGVVTEHGHEPFKVNLVTSNSMYPVDSTGAGTMSVIDDGAGITDPYTGKSSAIVPHIIPVVRSDNKSELILASPPTSLLNGWLANLGPITKASLGAFIAKYAVRSSKSCKLVAFRAPPTSNPLDPSLPSNAREAYANLDSSHNENVFRAIILRLWSFFDKETRASFEDADTEDPDWQAIIQNHSAKQPDVLTGSVLGAWQVHTMRASGEDKQVNMFVVTIAALKAVWSSLFDRLDWDRTFMPYTSVGVRVNSLTNDKAEDRLQIVYDHEQAISGRLVYLYIIMEITTAMWRSTNNSATSVLEMVPVASTAAVNSVDEEYDALVRAYSKTSVGSKPSSTRKYAMKAYTP